MRGITPEVIFSYIVVGFFVLGIPGAFTLWNIINCVNGTRNRRILAGTGTIFIGGFFYLLLLAFFDPAGDWNVPVYPDQTHYMISSEYSPIIILPAMLGFIGLLILLYCKPENMPPLVSVFSIASVILLNVISIVFAIQLSARSITNLQFCFYIYHFNILLISVDLIRNHMKSQAAYLSSRKEEFEDRKNLMWLYMKVTKVSQYAFPVFLALFFIVAAFEIFAILAGQGVDAPVKAFTDTADWTFSQQTPPPPIEYDGHYLCTVAAGGHKKIVKPIRFGRRRGAIIVVNRQLCIANAFEESIADHFPKFHKWIRHVYDTYGYPLSNDITTQGRADAVYFLMKPLVWVSLIYLYLTDRRPEERINRQYML